MRHRVNKTIFSRDTKHRKAMIRSGVRALFEHGQITTTKPKAKEYQRWADKLIHTAQKGDLSARRQLHSFFGKRDVVNTLVERIVPLFPKRTSGFSRIVSVGKRRGDNTEVFRLELINKPELTGTFKKPADKKAAKPTKKAAAKKAAPKTAKKADKKESKPAKKAAKKASAKKTTKKTTKKTSKKETK